jgi:hypothetical protein
MPPGIAAPAFIAVWTALRLHDPALGPTGGSTPIDGKGLVAMGRATARGYSYICTGAGCGIPMTPVFSQQVKERLQAHMAHFRAGHGHAHAPSCPAAAAYAAAVGARPTQFEARSVVSERPDAPVAFCDDPVPRRIRPPGTLVGNSGGASATQTAGGASAVGGSVHRSRSTARTLAQVVRYWRLDPAYYGPKELAFPFCPGRTFAGVFRELNEKNSLDPPTVPYIHWSDAVEVRSYGEVGYLVRFPHRTRVGKLFTCWIPRVLDKPLPVDTDAALRSAALGAPHAFYVFGTCRWDRERKRFGIDPERVTRVCAVPIALPADAL